MAFDFPLLKNQFGNYNYLQNGNFDRLDAFSAQSTGAQNWNQYKDAAATTPVDGTAGSPTVIQNAVISASPLRGLKSWQLSKTGNAQGEGYSSDFTIDIADKSRQLNISFDFSAGTAYTAGDLAVFIYDITNSTLITPTVSSIPSGSGSFQAGFAATTSTSYRLIIHCAASNATTTNWTMTLDNMQVNLFNVFSGSAVTDWQIYTPTIGGLGTVSTNTAYWRRVGDSVEVQGYCTTGTPPGAVGASIGLPSGLVLDTTKLTASKSAILGSAIRGSTGTNAIADTANGPHIVMYSASSTTAVYISGDVNKTFPVFNEETSYASSGDTVSYHFTAPITGWSSNVLLTSSSKEEFAYNTTTDTSNDTTSFGNGPTGVLVPNRTVGTQVSKQIRFQTPIQPTDHIVLEILQGGGTFTTQWIPWDTLRGGTIYQGASIYGVSIFPITGSLTDLTVTFNAQGWRANNATYAGNGSGFDTLFSNGDKWRVRKSSGPAASQVEQGGSIRASAFRTGSSQTLTAGVVTEIIQNTKRYDTHTAYSTSTGRFTAPRNGNYLVIASPTFINGGTAPTLLQAYFLKNATGDLLGTNITSQLTAGKEQTMPVMAVVNMVAGDFISLWARADTTGVTTENTGGTADVGAFTVVALGF